MKKTFSYLWPLTKKYDSKYSGTVEVTYLNGRKVLDSKNANYSYGSLQQVLDIGLTQTKADRSADVLILGLGGGSVIGLLRKKFNYYGKITAVEIDPDIINIAVNEFSIKQHAPLELICADASTYVQKTTSRFGLVIVDLFIDVKVPEEFYSIPFWQNISGLMEKKGSVLFNAGIHSVNRKEINQLLKEMQQEVSFRKLENVHASNTLLIGKKK